MVSHRPAAARRPQVFGYCMFKDGNQAKIEYPREGSVAEVAGRSFHNGACDSGGPGRFCLTQRHRCDAASCWLVMCFLSAELSQVGSYTDSERQPVPAQMSPCARVQPSGCSMVRHPLRPQICTEHWPVLQHRLLLRPLCQVRCGALLADASRRTASSCAAGRRRRQLARG